MDTNDIGKFISMKMAMMGNDEPLYSVSRSANSIRDAVKEANAALEAYMKRVEENPNDYPSYEDDEFVIKVELIRRDGLLKRKK